MAAAGSVRSGIRHGAIPPLGIHPVATAGHSLGELSALCLAGVYSLEDGFRIVNMRARCMDNAAGMHMDPAVMAAVDAPLDLLKELIQGRRKMSTSAISIHQGRSF